MNKVNYEINIIRSVPFWVMIFVLFLAIYAGKTYSKVKKLDQNNFDWEHVEVEKELIFSSITFTNNKLIISSSETEGIIKTLVSLDSLSGKQDYVSFLKIMGERDYFLGVGFVRLVSEGVQLTQLNWLNGRPDNLKNVSRIEKVRVERIRECGPVSICTLGDTYIINEEAQSLRYDWWKLNQDLCFVGSKLDAFGFLHDGQLKNTTESLINRLENIPVADVYTLSVGREESWRSDPLIIKNIQSIVNSLIQKNLSSKILLLTIIPSKGREGNERVKRLNEMIYTCGFSGNVEIVDVASMVRFSQTPFKKDGFNLSRNFLLELVAVLNERIDE